jgi:glycosyltransferase involved in cell wall biosynthesis
MRGRVIEVSVVMPVYNAEPHLGEALAALAAQITPRAWELIVVDNGSTDTSATTARSYADQLPNLRVIAATARQGAAYARNTGARVACAELILFCDQDDVVAPGWIEAMAAGLEEAPLVGGRTDVERLNLPATQAWRPSMVAGEPPQVQGRSFVSTHNLGCRRELFEALGGFTEDTSIAEDVDFSLRASGLGVEPHVVDDALVHYRYRTSARSALSQAYGYGRTLAGLYGPHELITPTVVDLTREAFRQGKTAARELCARRAPRGALWELAMLAGETAVIVHDRAFWRLGSTRTSSVAFWPVQWHRAARLRARLGSVRKRL